MDAGGRNIPCIFGFRFRTDISREKDRKLSPDMIAKLQRNKFYQQRAAGGRGLTREKDFETHPRLSGPAKSLLIADNR